MKSVKITVHCIEHDGSVLIGELIEKNDEWKKIGDFCLHAIYSEEQPVPDRLDLCLEGDVLRIIKDRNNPNEPVHEVNIPAFLKPKN